MKNIHLIFAKKLPRVLLVLSLLLCINSYPGLANPDLVLKTGVQAFSTKGITLKLVPETLVDTSLSMEGDFFSAFLTQPSAEILRVPKGTRLTGAITKIQQASSFNRGAKLTAHVSTLVLPDGTKVKIRADFSSKATWQETESSNSFKNTAMKLAKGSAEISTASLVGAMDSMQYTGIGTAISTSGISTAIGAGLGLGLGFYGAVTKKGNELISSSFNPVNFKLESEFEFLEKIPLLSQEIKPVSASLLGVDMKLNSAEKYFSKNYGEFILLDLSLKNNSSKKIFLGDFVLSSQMHILPVMNNPLITNFNNFQTIAVGENANFKLAFSLGSVCKKFNYQLLMLDPVSQAIIADLEFDISSYLG